MSDVRPFKIAIPDSELADLRARLALTRFPEKETPDDWSQGVPLAYVKEVAAYWQSEYDWRRAEAQINAFPQFHTTIDGLDIHFLHVRSPNENALPLVMTHGWPGSIVEFLKVIGPLADPAAHGGIRQTLSRRPPRAAGLRLLRQAQRRVGAWRRRPTPGPS
ncbi:MAG: epoxide hydrolase N-terminal domain-containing protein [Pseudomonadales bacterium]